MNNKIEEIIQGFNYAKNILNTITVTGIDNCQKISMVYNNIDVFLSMVNSGKVCLAITDKDAKNE